MHKTAIALPFFFTFAIMVDGKAVIPRRETERMRNVAKSPVISEMTEVVTGTSTIRAFGKEK